ncbi:MAG TPA: glycoside hydrolase family 18 protein [Puia sp.]|nr:glycoside hydrolase family 18 protein [Puia sp.]
MISRILLLFLFNLFLTAQGQTVIAYYSGNAENIDRYPVGQLTHIIYSFCYLKKNTLHVDRRTDSLAIKKLVSFKKDHPSLKILLSLGGWGGCRTCSTVFATAEGRESFARSVLELTNYFHTDGIDLDWEYPTLGGYPGHPFSPADKENFTSLLRALRASLGPSKEISFILAGFSPYLRGSIDVVSAARIADRINLMTYDMVGSRSPVTGHHTALYSTPRQQASVDNAVRYLDSLKIPHDKIAIGATFYGRRWDRVGDRDHGLHQPGVFTKFVSMRQIRKSYTPAGGYRRYWDDTAQAPYLYNAACKVFLTYDDERSVTAKAAYVKKNGLNGIMFWELRLDAPRNGLLSIISQSFHKREGLR